MDISIYFEPVEYLDYPASEHPRRRRFGEIINTFKKGGVFPDTDEMDIAILGVREDRRSINNQGCALAPDQIRKSFYNLFPGDFKVRIADLGDIKQGHRAEDSYFAVKSVVAYLVSNQILPIIIGGSQDITYANYLAYESIGQIINIASVDSEFDIGESENDIDSRSYLSKIIMHKPNFLFNFTNIGFQTYYVNQDAIRLMKNLFFDAYRVGEIRANLREVEPLVRNADLLSFDISSVRYSDAPANGNASPNGFYGEEACQIVRYAGLSEKLTSIGFYEINPSFDQNNQTANLVAQMIWYFLDGYCRRVREFPYKDQKNFIKYHVKVDGQKDELVFFKSKVSDRWWMEINCPSDIKLKYERHYLVPCSFKDYQIACENDIPDRWWQAYQKLM